MALGLCQRAHGFGRDRPAVGRTGVPQLEVRSVGEERFKARVLGLPPGAAR